MNNKNMKNIMNHLITNGFVFPGSEIYGGLSNTWDYGPFGTLIKENIKNAWINKYTRSIEDVVFLDSSILMNKKVWEASGHIKKFSDPLVDCKNCKMRYRADNLIEFQLKIDAESLSNNELAQKLSKINCPNCKKSNFTSIRNFNLMFKTQQGVLINKKNEIYLRPETAQGIFINFKNVQRSLRMKLPFGIAQVGKAFRNEITPGNFTFRTREFEQMEMEYFIYEEENIVLFDMLVRKSFDFIKNLGINTNKLRLKIIDKESLAHYALENTDIEYEFPFGWGEIGGIAQRGNYDLTAHQNYSGEKLTYINPITNKKIIPFVIEPTFGLSRITLMIMIDAYTIDITDKKERVFMNIDYHLAPYKIAFLPLVKKLSTNTKKVFLHINKAINSTFDDSGSIGKRYTRQDLIGTPFCITYDYNSINDKKVTIRIRNTMKQQRIDIQDIIKYVKSYIEK